MKRVLLIVAIVLIPLVPIVLVVTGVIKRNPQTISPVPLVIWGTENENTALAPLIETFQQTRPYAQITYQQIRPEDYYQQLVDGWAKGEGPDLFFAPHSWLGQMTGFAVPMPAQLGVNMVLPGGGLFKSTTKIEAQNLPAPTVTALQNTYVDAVTNDVVVDGQVWGLPLSMDTIVTYYNKDLLNNAKIFEPATTWAELVSQVDVNHLSVIDENDNLVQSAVAIGTVDNVPYAIDLLQLLWLQNGVAAYTNEDQRPLASTEAKDAFEFYTAFASRKKIAYSWNTTQPNAKQAFLSGKLAYYFGTLQDRADFAGSQVNWGVGPMLHLSDAGDRDASSGQARLIDASRYNVLMVSRASATRSRDRLAWNFLYYVTRPEIVGNYLGATGKLSAVKSILAQQKNDETLGVYAGQLLTAKTWYHGGGGQQVENYLHQMVTSVITGQTTIDEALRLAGEQISTTL